jgi:hypothetical protein
LRLLFAAKFLPKASSHFLRGTGRPVMLAKSRWREVRETRETAQATYVLRCEPARSLRFCTVAGPAQLLLTLAQRSTRAAARHVIGTLRQALGY